MLRRYYTIDTYRHTCIYSLLKLCGLVNFIVSRIPSYLSSRREFSVSQRSEPHKPDSGNSVHEPQSRIPKILTGGVALGSVFLAAYYYGFLDSYLGKKQQSISEYTKARIGDNNTQTSPEQPNAHHQASELSETITGNSSQEPDVSSSDADHAKQDVETHSELSAPENSVRTEEDKNFQAKDMAVQTAENVDRVVGGDVPNVPQSSMSLDDVNSKPAEESFDLKSPGVKPDEEQVKAIEITPTVTSADKVAAKIEFKSVPKEQTTTQDMQEVVQGDGTQKSNSLLDDYYLKDNAEELATSSSEKIKDISSRIEDVYDGYITKDGKLVLDFLQAIHAAEERQAALDARSFSEEKRAMKELTKERVKAAAALKSLQEKLEEKLKTELEQKELEVEQKLKQMRDIAKAELAAAIASEKASQIEKMAEANLNINALCMAFYARSEEARQSHSVHKLALGALALEYTLSKGLPIQKEIEALRTHLEGIDKDSLIALLDALKGTLRHFSLIPPGGGGILSHSLAHIASWLKVYVLPLPLSTLNQIMKHNLVILKSVKEADQSGNGIESLINRVESLLAQGKLSEAADTLENGVKGSQAAEVVDDWVRRARERAITEQALTIIQSYATSVSLT
ncbi:hypothetical protein DH2020_015390 [Rehmannia glutinosa]|uniref:MICOS complex subunit MIC60 n=1 Tax=Rehmannia glutinosa TaxID=99300 RepID=A0ABR0WSH5_REHGL